MQKFYVTKKSIIFSSLVLFFTLVLTFLYLFVWGRDPYQHFYESVKESVLESLGVEIKATKSDRSPLFRSFELESVEVKFRSKDTPFFEAETVALRMPFINLLFAFTSKNTPLNVYVKNAHINIQEDSIESTDDSIESSVVEPNRGDEKKNNLRLFERPISLTLDNFSLDVNTSGFNISTDNLYADVAFDKDLNFENFSLKIPSLSLMSASDVEFSLSGGSAAITEDDKVNFWFDETYIKTNKNDISINVNNFSPYIERNERGNQTLYLPLKETVLSVKDESLYIPSSLFSLEFASWREQILLARVDSAVFEGNAGVFRVGDFDARYRILENTQSLFFKGEATILENAVIAPLSLSFNATFDSLSPSINGRLGISDITFEGVSEKFDFFADVQNSKANLSLLSKTINDGESALFLNAEYDISSRFLELNLSFNDLSSEVLFAFKQFPSLVVPNNSLINGSLTLRSNAEVRNRDKFEAFGRAIFSISEIGFSSIKSDVKLNSLIHIENSTLSIPEAKVSLFGTDLSFSLSKRLGEVFPVFKAELKKDERLLSTIELDRNRNFALLSSDKNLGLSGRFTYTDKDDLLFSGNAKLYSYNYPMTLGLNLKDSLLSFVCMSLRVNGSYRKNGSIRFEANNFETPHIPRLKLLGSKLNFNALLRLTNGFTLSVNSFDVEVQDALKLGFRGVATKERISLNNILIRTKNNFYNGDFNISAKNGVWDFKNITFGGALESPDKSSYVYTSYLSDEDNISLFLNIKDLEDLNSVISIPFDKASLMLIFESDMKTNHSAYGNVLLSERKEDGNDFSFNFAYANDEMNITDLKLDYASMLRIDKASAMLNLKTGLSHLNFSLLYLLAQSDEPNPFSFDVNAGGNIKELLDKKFNLSLLEKPSELNVKLSNANFGNTFFPPLVDGRLTFDKNKLTFFSNIIKGDYDFDSSYFNLDIDKSFSFGLNASGRVKDGFMDVSVKNIYFPFKILDIIVWSDAVGFVDGIFKGEARFYGPVLSPEIFGYLEAPKATMWYLWAEKETCMIVNPLINFYGTTMNIPKTDVYAQNKDTGRISHFYASAEFTIRSWDLPYMKVIMDIDENNPVSVSVPLPVPNLEIEVDEVWGHCEIGLHHLVYPDLNFDLIARNGTISGPARYPKWMYDPDYVADPSTASYGSEYTKLYGLIRVQQGAKFLFPNKNSPMINATLSENQSAELIYENDSFYLNGDLNIQSGDIYYFQKNFLITEGNIAWHRLDLSRELFGSSDFAGITINLVSRLRDFDLNGEPTDIYLTLNNATIDNIAPHLSSSTGISDAEIMYILGQNILPSSTYTSSGISTLVYLSSVALDVASRVSNVPRLNPDNFDATVEKALGLDMFSIRQRIFYNLLVDVIPERGKSYSDSAFARYLNGTSLFLGKHISENWFFQTTLNFFSSESYARDKRLNDFFIQGLKGEIEFALEWNNPLASFSVFSSPNELSFFGILDNIGISVKKHFLL